MYLIRLSVIDKTMMKHSNPEAIDHTRNNIYQALTGDLTRSTEEFLEEKLTPILETIDSMNEHWAGTNSHVLELIIKDKTMTDEQKAAFIFELGFRKGAKAGSDEICHECALGPASTILHKLASELGK